MEIRRAKTEEFQSVRAFYHALIDAVGEATDSVCWKKDVYPAPDFLREAIQKGELFVGAEGAEIVAAMVLNHACHDSYLSVQWPTEAEASEVAVIHALGVHPAHTRRGRAKQMVRFAADFARQQGQKVIRLDVLKGNVAAKRLYTALGFTHCHTLPLYYEDTGWTDFELYEYRL